MRLVASGKDGVLPASPVPQGRNLSRSRKIPAPLRKGKDLEFLPFDRKLYAAHRQSDALIGKGVHAFNARHRELAPVFQRKKAVCFVLHTALYAQFPKDMKNRPPKERKFIRYCKTMSDIVLC